MAPSHTHYGTPIPLETHSLAESGVFEGYATVFGVPIERSFGIIVMDQGMFRDSLKKNGPQNIRLLWQHDPDQVIGIYEEIQEDARGVWVKGRLLVDEIPKAREVYSLMKHQAIGGLSVGFGVEESHTDKQDSLIHYTKADLWEVSAVTFPANSQAKINRVHSKVNAENKLLTPLRNLNSILRGE